VGDAGNQFLATFSHAFEQLEERPGNIGYVLDELRFSVALVPERFSFHQVDPQLLTAQLQCPLDADRDLGDVVPDVFLARPLVGNLGGNDRNKHPDLVPFLVDFVGRPVDLAGGHPGANIGTRLEKERDAVGKAHHVHPFLGLLASEAHRRLHQERMPLICRRLVPRRGDVFGFQDLADPQVEVVLAERTQARSVGSLEHLDRPQDLYELRQIPARDGGGFHDFVLVPAAFLDDAHGQVARHTGEFLGQKINDGFVVAPFDELADDDVVDGTRVVLDFLGKRGHLFRSTVVPQRHVAVGFGSVLVDQLELGVGRDDGQLLQVRHDAGSVGGPVSGNQ